MNDAALRQKVADAANLKKEKTLGLAIS